MANGFQVDLSKLKEERSGADYIRALKTNKKKRIALVSISVILCCALLLGITFAMTTGDLSVTDNTGASVDKVEFPVEVYAANPGDAEGDWEQIIKKNGEAIDGKLFLDQTKDYTSADSAKPTGTVVSAGSMKVGDTFQRRLIIKNTENVRTGFSIGFNVPGFNSKNKIFAEAIKVSVEKVDSADPTKTTALADFTDIGGEELVKHSIVDYVDGGKTQEYLFTFTYNVYASSIYLENEFNLDIFIHGSSGGGKVFTVATYDELVETINSAEFASGDTIRLTKDITIDADTTFTKLFNLYLDNATTVQNADASGKEKEVFVDDQGRPLNTSGEVAEIDPTTNLLIDPKFVAADGSDREKRKLTVNAKLTIQCQDLGAIDLGASHPGTIDGTGEIYLDISRSAVRTQTVKDGLVKTYNVRAYNGTRYIKGDAS